MRNVNIRIGCECSNSGITKALQRDEFEKAAARRRRRPVFTHVGRFAARREPPLARKIAKALRRHAKALARAMYPLVEKNAPAGLRKASADPLVQRALDILAAQGLPAEMVDILRPEVEAAFRTGGRYGIEQAGFGTQGLTEQVDAEAVFWAANRGGQLMRDFADTTDEAVRGVLSTAVEEGWGPEELEDAIMDLGAFGQARAEMIARTELAFAHVQGNVEGWRATGEVVGKRWILGDLHEVEDVCDDCAEAGVVDLEDTFGDTGIDFPPAHPNCWCDVVPILRAAPELEDEGD